MLWEIVRSMPGENAAKEIFKIPLSDHTVSRRINDMAADILEQLRDKLLESKLFYIQSDIKGKCHQRAKVRFVGSDFIQKSFLFCRELPAHSTGAEICNTTAKCLEEKMLQWKNCVNVCINCVASMMEKSKEFVSKDKS